jgi:hypothetical protein
MVADAHSSYTVEVADFILEKLAEGVSLREICREHANAGRKHRAQMGA